MVDAETGERLSLSDSGADIISVDGGSINAVNGVDGQQPSDMPSAAVRKKRSALAKFVKKHGRAQDEAFYSKSDSEHTLSRNQTMENHSNSAASDNSLEADLSSAPVAQSVGVLGHESELPETAIESPSCASAGAASASRKKRSVLGRIAERHNSQSGSSTASLRDANAANESSTTSPNIDSVVPEMLSSNVAHTAAEQQEMSRVNARVPKPRLHLLQALSGSREPDASSQLTAGSVQVQPLPPDDDSGAEDVEQMRKNMEELVTPSLKSKPPSGSLTMSSSLPNVAAEDSSPEGKNHWAGIARRVGSATLGRTETGSISNLSYASAPMSATARNARKRNFLIGGVSADGGLMGAQELERLFPDRTLTLYVGTWNTAQCKDVPEKLDDFILPEDFDSLPDIYALTVQENSFDKREWSVKLQETLGPSHVLFCTQEHGALLMDIFVKRDLIWHLSVPETANVTTRVFKQWKTKGAVAISFTLFGTSFLFIGSHLKAHHGRLKERLQDCEAVIKGLDLPRQVIHDEYKRDRDVTARFDVVFWFGDLNFRLNRSREQVLNCVASAGNYDLLLEHDELIRERNSGSVFGDFQEGHITFPPSFKFDINSEEFDSSVKQRIPAYTDRILFRSKKKNGVACCQYKMVRSIRQSDHRPVYGVYRVSLRPGRDSIPLSAGYFNRDVFVEAARRRSLQKLIVKLRRGNNPSSVCNVM